MPLRVSGRKRRVGEAIPKLVRELVSSAVAFSQ
jgi:hypothetical protein